MALSGHHHQWFGDKSWSQHMEDGMVLNLFYLIGIRKPSYLDIGAHHPTELSNTKLLYDHGCRGVNVDANPMLIEIFKHERPDDKNVCVGVGVEEKSSASFYMYGEKSGRNTFSSEEVNEMKGIIQVKTVVRFPVKTLDQIVKEYCPGGYPEFLSIDIEGWDFDVLRASDFSVYPNPMVVCVETRRADTQKMREMMKEKEYFLYCRLGENLIFVRTRLMNAVY